MNSRPRSAAAAVGRGYGYLLAGGVTGIAALLAGAGWLLVWVTSVPGPGRRAWRPLCRWTASLGRYERRRAGILLSRSIAGAFTPVVPVPGAKREGRRGLLRCNAADRGFRRTLGWLPAHGLLGPVALMLALGQPVSAVVSVVQAVRWWGSDSPVPYPSSFFFTVDSTLLAATATALTLGLTAVVVAAVPALARAQARLAGLLLALPAVRRLAERVQELTASRAAALEAHGTELRRIERDLHDGAQARMAAVAMQLGIAERAVGSDPARVLALIRQARDTATDSLAELRETVRTIYPPVLDDCGLEGAVSALAARCPIPCTVRAEDVRRAPAAVEAAAYFMIAESLANAAKHSAAERVHVSLRTTGRTLLMEITDDGRGGADMNAGSGLTGMRRRAEAFDGRVLFSSPVGGPTRIRAELPCAW
ncbi:sensor histidine kinase [Streptomyces sp. NPDC007983]|uniref:sensor histidine kinase n=1 Tax=Streptomyces sp. NPDC007983 TaxID=3364800 RepID=UPI0036E3463D